MVYLSEHWVRKLISKPGLEGLVIPIISSLICDILKVDYIPLGLLEKEGNEIKIYKGLEIWLSFESILMSISGISIISIQEIRDLYKFLALYLSRYEIDKEEIKYEYDGFYYRVYYRPQGKIFIMNNLELIYKIKQFTQ